MISVVFTDVASSLHRHRVYFKVNQTKRREGCLNNQFWLIDFPASAQRSAEEAARMYGQWLEAQLIDQPLGPVATKLRQLAQVHLSGGQVEIMVFQGAEHGYELRTILAELADGMKHQQPTQTALFNRNQQPDVEFVFQEELRIDPDDEPLWTTAQLRDERIVRIIGNRSLMLGVMVSASEALVPGHDLVPLKADRWFYDGAAASPDEKQQLQAALTHFMQEEWFNEREVGGPETRFEDPVEGFFLDEGVVLNEADQVLLDVDTDQEAAERTIIGWYHKRDLKRTSDVAGLGLLVERHQ